MKKTGIIVQARMGSTRMPGKILQPFDGYETILDILLSNLHRVENAKVIVATSTNPNNDQLEEYLLSKGELVYRGSEDDVLNRFIAAAEYFEVDGIVRICSDNPFLDYRGVEDLIDSAKKTNADYVGFMVDGKPSIKTHFGFWGEFATLDALKRAAIVEDTMAHEHVTLYLYTHPEQFHCEWIDCPKFLSGRNDIRLTIDTFQDFCNAQTVYKALSSQKKDFDLRDIVDYLDKHPLLTESMKSVICENQK